MMIWKLEMKMICDFVFANLIIIIPEGYTSKYTEGS